MTTVIEVSQREMKNRTGFGKALGYAFPEEDEILVRKDLPKKKKKEVLAHEEEHILKGEEGPFLNLVIPAIAAIGGAVSSSKSAKRATNAQSQAAADEIAFAEESRDLVRADQAPYVKAGHTALQALMSMTGLATPRRAGGSQGNPLDTPTGMPVGEGYLRGLNIRRGRNINPNRPRLHARNYGGPIGRRVGGAIRNNVHYNINEEGPERVFRGGSYTRNSQPSTIDGQTGYVLPHGGPVSPPGGLPFGNTGGLPGAPRENPGGVEGGYNFQTDPGYNFRLSEGERVLSRGAAAAGGLLSGGYGRRAMRYGQDYASSEYENVYNRIASIAGLSQVSNQIGSNAAMAASGQVGGALQNRGYAQASGYTAEGNAWGTAINQISQLPWGQQSTRDKIESYRPTGKKG